jgi:hypothetical protein
MDWGTVAQWTTAGIAGGAFLAACVSINSQRAIARKRAAIDFFTKTEMDGELLIAHERFSKAVEILETHLGGQTSIDAFVDTEPYRHIRAYLNLHELMGVGINKGVLDEKVCYDFWSGEMRRAYEKTKPLIEKIQELPSERHTYIELVSVSERWIKRDKRKGRG